MTTSSHDCPVEYLVEEGSHRQGLVIQVGKAALAIVLNFDEKVKPAGIDILAARFFSTPEQARARVLRKLEELKR